uniref:SCAN box domain-containing protein n=1 Tax=Takifugu rubripes TaxID=31033 RepID=A0A674MJC2_TAKRU
MATLLLQCVLTGKAQEAFSALSMADSENYNSVKIAVLKAYELVPEAYRQKFRTSRKHDKTYVEFVRELTTLFNRWRIASGVETFPQLCELILLEQFKFTLPERIATFLAEHKVKSASEAAVLADEYKMDGLGLELEVDLCWHFFLWWVLLFRQNFQALMLL